MQYLLTMPSIHRTKFQVSFMCLIGEEAHQAFFGVQSLLDDFVQSNVETAATMVEAAGRFLYSLPETCIRMSNMLEVSGWPCLKTIWCSKQNAW